MKTAHLFVRLVEGPQRLEVDCSHSLMLHWISIRLRLM